MGFGTLRNARTSYTRYPSIRPAGVQRQAIEVIIKTAEALRVNLFLMDPLMQS